MKSMKRMQDEMLAKARFDGGWPKAVHVGIGVIALADNQEEYDALIKSSTRSNLLGVVIGIVVSVIAIVMPWIFAG